nr:retrovirus-related Pol polyprotein from transposon TNT 1-94 [Tanacetum cinerariifolium]
MVAASKVPMLKPVNGATLPRTQVVDGVTTVMPISIAEEKAQRRLEVKLELLGKKLSQEDVNQKLLRSLSPEWNTHVVVWRNKADLYTMSMDYIYNKLKVFEPEVKRMSSSNSNTQNMAFLSSINSSTNEVVNTARVVNTTQAFNIANGVSTASTQVNAAFLTNIDNISDTVICAFLDSQPNSPQLAHEDLEQIHPDDMEEIDLRWQMVMLTMRARRALRNKDFKYKESTRRIMPVETPASTTLVSCDGLGGYDGSDQAEEWPNYALMAYTSLTSDSKDKGVIDSGCSRHMTRNMSYLTHYEEIDGGYVAFGGNPKGGKITGKGIDYDEVFAPVTRIEAIRLLLAYASFKDFVVYQMDVKSAFLYGKIEEDVYICQLPGFEDSNFPDRVYKVEKAPKAWSMISSLMYLTSSKLDIMFAVCAFARYQVNLEVSHIHAVKRIFRKPKRKNTQVPQPSGSIEHLADEAIHKEKGDKLERATTTASSLEVEQDSGNIDKIQSKETPNEASSPGTTLGGGPRGNILQSDEDSMKLNKLMELCTNLQSRVLALEKTKTTQALEITSLKRRVKKLDKKQRLRTHKLKRLYKVGLIARVYSSKDEQNLGEDASKQGKIEAIDADEDISLVNDQDYAEMFDVKDLQGKEVFVDKEVTDKEVNDEVQKVVEVVVEDINTAKLIVDAAHVSVVGEVNVASIATTDSAAATITIDEVTLAKALAELKASIPKDKGKGIMVKETMKLKKNDQIRLDEEVALKLQAELQAEFNEKQRKRRKFFAAKRAEEKRNKPPTQAQQRKIMCTYLKNMEEKKLKDLKNKSFDSIQKMFDKDFKRVNTFVDFRTEVDEGSSKRAREELKQERSKKQKYKVNAAEELQLQKQITTADTRVKTARGSYYCQYKEVNAAQVEVSATREHQEIY